MKMDIVAGSGNDEFYTPEYAILPIMKYLKPNSYIWCPFDTNSSNFVKLLTKAGHKVDCTHLNYWSNFFDYTPNSDVDYIISNPPYSCKKEVFERSFSFKIPSQCLYELYDYSRVKQDLKCSEIMTLR